MGPSHATVTLELVASTPWRFDGVYAGSRLRQLLVDPLRLGVGLARGDGQESGGETGGGEKGKGTTRTLCH